MEYCMSNLEYYNILLQCFGFVKCFLKKSLEKSYKVIFFALQKVILHAVQ